MKRQVVFKKGILSYLLNHNHLVDNPTFPKKLRDWSAEDVQKYFNSKAIFKKYADTMAGLNGEDLASISKEYLQFLMGSEDGGACFTLLEKYKRAGTHFSDYKSTNELSIPFLVIFVVKKVKKVY